MGQHKTNQRRELSPLQLTQAWIQDHRSRGQPDPHLKGGARASGLEPCNFLPGSLLTAHSSLSSRTLWS